MKHHLTPTLLLTVLLSTITVLSCKKDKDDDTETAVNLYFTYWDDNSVNKIDLVNSPNKVTQLFDALDGIHSPAGITLTDDGYLIVAEENGDRIIKVQTSGTGDVAVLYDNTDGVSEPTAVTINTATGEIYWCNSGTDQVMKGSADGLATPFVMYDGQPVIGYAYGIALDTKNNKLITSDFYQGIKVGDLLGTGTTEVLWDHTKYAGMGYPSSIFVDPDRNKIYWADESAYTIVEANLDGTGNPVVLFDDSDGINRADGVFVDYNAQKIYWSETSSHVIARGNLDGSGTREVLVDSVSAYGLVIEME
jgi:sugar lactone lactonase YvrE